MGKRGPRPRPKKTIVIPPGEPEMPATLREHGQAEWLRAAAELRAQGRLTRDCGPVLHGIAVSFQRMQEAEALVEQHGLLMPGAHGDEKANPAVRIASSAGVEWRAWLCQAGLTPATLGKMKIEPAAEVDELEKFRVTG